MTKVGDGNNAGMQDISREEMSSHRISKTKGGQVEVRQKLDGKIESNIVYGENFPKNVRETIDAKMLKFQGVLDDVRQQAAQARANGQPNLAAELEHQADRLQTVMNEMKIGIEKANLTGDQFKDGGKLAQMSVSISNIESNTIADIREIQKNVGVDAANNLTPMMVAPDPEPIMGYTMADGDKSVSEMTDDEKGAWVAERLSDPEQLVSDFETNPKEFFADLGHLDSNDRQSIIMTLQTKIQSDNQLYSTLTNFIKAMHDTEKAAISNLRV